jgi:hypothetical protein
VHRYTGQGTQKAFFVLESVTRNKIIFEGMLIHGSCLNYMFTGQNTVLLFVTF